MSGPRLGEVAALLDEGRAEGVAPGLSAAVVARGRLVHASHHGEAQIVPERVALGPGHLFDVASLTKVMATTTAAAVLHGRGELPLEARVARFLPAFAGGGKEEVTVRHLLSHSSGLPRWRPFYEVAMLDPVARVAFLPPAERARGRLGEAFARGRAIVEEAVLAEPLEARPGARAAYSDLGFLLLGFVLERVGDESLDRLCHRLVFAPLGLKDTFFIDERSPEIRETLRRGREFVATERCPHRGEVNRGSVNDDNAWAVGGVAGHAGLFSTAREVAALGQAWLDALRGRPGVFDLPERAAALFAARQPTEGGTFALGWDTPSAEASSLGTRLGRGARGAIGHLAFTGCSLWIDIDREVVAALLTNRVHPSRDNEAIRAFRPRFHDAVARALRI